MAVAATIRFLGGEPEVFFNSYLTSFCFVWTICMGCLFIVTILHFDTGWLGNDDPPNRGTVRGLSVSTADPVPADFDSVDTVWFRRSL